MSISLSLFWTDILIFLLIFSGIVALYIASRREYWRIAAREIASSRSAMICFGILSIYFLIGITDSIRYKTKNENGNWNAPKTLLDKMLDDVCQGEKTYSKPFALYSLQKETVETPSGIARVNPPLKHAGSHLGERTRGTDIFLRILSGIGIAIIFALVYFGLLVSSQKILYPDNDDETDKEGNLTGDEPKLKITADKKAFFNNGLWVIGFLSLFTLLAAVSLQLATHYHIFGTDKAGQDIFRMTLKGVRTALVIGTLTTLIVTPLAIIMGVVAGYFGGIVDSIVQYIYTTLSSIPSIMLIIAGMIIIDIEGTTAEVADLRLLYLCAVMGITSWTGLCRLIRAETLKLREVEYVQAADALGVSALGIMTRHLLPNLMYIVLITTVMRFSGLVMTEAVLAYIGVGVHSEMASWGGMINQARSELARSPMVWWQLSAAFVFMFTLVLSANIFGDSVRDALDPKLRTK